MKLVSIVFALILSACGDVKGYAVNAAVEGCKEHGGVTEIYPDMLERHAVCQDGTRVLRLNRGIVK